MHEPFNPHCSHCRKFVYCFSLEGPLGDWGYCEEELPTGPPTAEDLRSLEVAAGQGNFAGSSRRTSPSIKRPTTAVPASSRADGTIIP